MDSPSKKIQLINTHQAKSDLSRLLRQVEEDGVIVRICRNGKPIAELRGLADAPNPLVSNPKLAAVVFHEDPLAPVSKDDWPEDLL